MGIPSRKALGWERNTIVSTPVPPFLSDSDGVSTTVEKEHIPRDISIRTHRCTKKRTVPESVVKDRMICDQIWGSSYSSHSFNYRQHTTRRRKFARERGSDRRDNLRTLSHALSFVGSPKAFRILEFLPSTTALWADRFLLDSLSATLAAGLTSLLLFQWTPTSRRRRHSHRSKRDCRHSRSAGSIGETGWLVGLSFLLILPVLLCMAGTIHWMLLLDVCIRHYLAKAVSTDSFAHLFPISFTGGVPDASTSGLPSQRLHSTLQLIVIALLWLRFCDAGQAFPMTWNLNIGLPDYMVPRGQTTRPILNGGTVPPALNLPRRTRRISSSSTSEEGSPRVYEYPFLPNVLNPDRIPTPPFVPLKSDYFNTHVQKPQRRATSRINQTASPVYITHRPHLAGNPYQPNNNTFHAQLKELVLSANYY